MVVEALRVRGSCKTSRVKGWLPVRDCRSALDIREVTTKIWVERQLGAMAEAGCLERWRSRTDGMERR